MAIHKLLEAPEKRIKQLEKLVDKQLEQIDRLRSAKKSSYRKAATKKRKGGFLRVLWGDSHGAYGCEKAIAAFLADLAELKPRELVCVGDAVSCDGFLAEHHTIGVVPQLDYTYEYDCQRANELLDKIAVATGDAPMRFIEGNHEARIGRSIAKMSLRNAADSRFLERMFGIEAVLSLSTRGIEYIRRHEYYDGLNITGTIRLDDWALAQHGEAFCGVNASRNLLSALGKNVFHGHTHKLGALYGENLSGTLIAVNTGCLCDLRPLYGLTKTTGWVHGYAIQFVQPGHGFLALPVPIIDGVSYLAPLLQLLRA